MAFSLVCNKSCNVTKLTVLYTQKRLSSGQLLGKQLNSGAGAKIPQWNCFFQIPILLVVVLSSRINVCSCIHLHDNATQISDIWEIEFL